MRGFLIQPPLPSSEQRVLEQDTQHKLTSRALPMNKDIHKPGYELEHFKWEARGILLYPTRFIGLYDAMRHWPRGRHKADLYGRPRHHWVDTLRHLDLLAMLSIAVQVNALRAGFS